MIFNAPGHIDTIRNGLRKHRPISFIPPRFYVKTQTRRMSRGIYQVGRNYAVQCKRGVKAEPDIRIVMDRIWIEVCTMRGMVTGGYFRSKLISEEDAWTEGGYSPAEFEKLFRDLNPKWDSKYRWAFEFHVIKTEKEIL